MPETPDIYDATRSFAMSMEEAGHTPDKIIDALLTVGLNSGCRLAGHEFVIGFLHRMIEVYSAGADRHAPPSKTQ